MNQLTWPEVAHLYLWCKVQYDNSIWTLREVKGRVQRPLLQLVQKPDDFVKYVDVWPDECKPMLRPLSSMTEEEEQHIINTWQQEMSPIEYKNMVILQSEEGELAPSMLACAEITLWACKKTFDLFNLIPTGQAIDATTL